MKPKQPKQLTFKVTPHGAFVYYRDKLLGLGQAPLTDEREFNRKVRALIAGLKRGNGPAQWLNDISYFDRVSS